MISTFASASAAAAPERVTVLHTNDWQSGLTGVGPDAAYTPDVTGDDETIGGVARLATLIDMRRASRAAEGPVLLLDGGDVTMGTLYHTVTRETGSEFQLMRLLGYDAVTLGNHEFDFRTKGFGEMVASASAADGLPPLVATNLDLSSEHPDLAVLASLYERGILQRTRIIERGGVKIGLVGILGVDAHEKMEAGTPVQVTPPIAAATEAVAALRADGAELIVVMSHSGVWKIDGAWAGEEVALMQAVPGIDVIVGGHSHTALPEPIMIAGRPIVQAGSDTQWLGELVIKRAGARWSVVSYELHAIDDAILGRADVTARVDRVKAEVDAQVLGPLGYRFDQVVAKVSGKHGRGFEDHVVGNLVVDAMRVAVGADFALTGSGTIRADLLPGELRVSDVFRVSGLGVGTVDETPGYPLVKVYMGGPTVKSVLEFMLIGYTLKGADYYPRFSGVRVHYNPLRVPFDRITKVELGSEEGGYRAIDLADDSLRISLATTTYIAKFLPIVRQLSYGILDTEVLDAADKPVPHLDLSGVLVDTSTAAGIQELKDWRALIDYVASRPDTDGDGLANLPEAGEASQPRMFAHASLTPSALFGGATWRMWTATAALCLFLLTLTVVLRAIVRRLRRR